MMRLIRPSFSASGTAE